MTQVDPVLIAAIGRQPRDLPAFLRAVRGVRAAWREVPEPDQPVIAESVERALAVIDPAAPEIRHG